MLLECILNYAYDEFGRMTSAMKDWVNSIDFPDEVTTYQFDAVGNLDVVEQADDFGFLYPVGEQLHRWLQQDTGS